MHMTIVLSIVIGGMGAIQQDLILGFSSQEEVRILMTILLAPIITELISNLVNCPAVLRQLWHLYCVQSVAPLQSWFVGLMRYINL